MRFILNKATNKIKRIILESNYRRTIPQNYQAEDIYLVSYPKSGNTWLRFLVANMLKVHYDIPRQVNFFSLPEFIPDIYTSRYVRKQSFFADFNLPRIIKSHANYNPYYNRVILLIRNPQDVCVSYYYFLQQRHTIAPNLTISQFIRSRKYGARAWLEHIRSWYRLLHDRQIIKVIRYEDLLINPQQQLFQIADLLGMKIAESSIDQAIYLSNKEAMKHSERTHLSTYLIKNQTIEFVRHTKANRGSTLSQTDKEYIETITKQIAINFDYYS